MSLDSVKAEVLAAASDWYDARRPNPDTPANRNVVCAGLALAEILRSHYPLRREHYVTDRDQVRTSQQIVQRILERFGETRVFAREGGRTTRGTLAAAEQLAACLNEVECSEELSEMDAAGRGEVANAIQAWLFGKVQEFFNQQHLDIELDMRKPGPAIISEIMRAAEQRNKGGQVAQHLVGAKLAIRFRDTGIAVENHSFTTADQQLGRPGDFVIGDTAFHVTVSPMPPVIEKCRGNLRAGMRAVLIVPEAKLEAAKQNADEIANSIGIYSLESFVGQNVEEIAAFRSARFSGTIIDLLQTYNERTREVETDLSLLIDIPANLEAEHGGR